MPISMVFFQQRRSVFQSFDFKKDLYLIKILVGFQSTKWTVHFLIYSNDYS